MGLRHKKNPHILLEKLDLDDSKRMRMDGVSPSSETQAFRHISASGSHASWKEGHFLIPATTKSRCFYCKIFTKSKCPNCDKHLCNVTTGRKCFNLYHEAFARKAEEKFADDEMSSDEMDEDIGHSISNSTDALQVFDEVYPSPSKTVDSRHISASGHHASSEEGHFLIRAARRSLCFYCKKRTRFKCPNCDKHFCNVKITRRECFTSYHNAEKFADSEISSDEICEDIGHSISNSTDALQVFDEVYPSPSKTVDSRHISASGHHASWEEGHFLIRAARRSVCFYCKTRTRFKCPNCDKHFCNVKRTRRECFTSYHNAEKFADCGISSDEIYKDVGHSISNSSATLQVLDDDDDDSDLEVVSETKPGQSSTEINHTPVFVKDKKVCFYCKTERSNWLCKTCGKSLCVQKTGKTCFHIFHSSPRKAKRPNMKHILQAYTQKSH